MKTIEQLATDKYISDLKLPEHKRLNPVHYIDWANFGARQAMREISVEDELPEDDSPILIKTAESSVYFTGFYSRNVNTWFCFDPIRKSYWRLDQRVTHWRLLNL